MELTDSRPSDGSDRSDRSSLATARTSLVLVTYMLGRLAFSLNFGLGLTAAMAMILCHRKSLSLLDPPWDAYMVILGAMPVTLELVIRYLAGGPYGVPRLL